MPNSAASGSSIMSQMSSMGAMAGGAASGMGIKNPNDQQVSLLKSRTVEMAMVNRFQLKARYHTRYVSSACKKWERHTKTDSGLKDGLIRLSVTDVDPRRAAEMANAWVDEYRKLTAELAVTEASRRSQFYEQQLATAKTDLVVAEEALKQTEQRTGVIDMEGQDRTLLASAAVARGQVAAKQIEIKAMMQFASDHNPDLERAREELAGMEAQLASMDAAKTRKAGDIVVPKGNVTQSALDYERAMREVKFHETIVELLTRQYEGARVDVARQGSTVEVVDPAIPPERPSSHYRLWIALSAFLLALPISVGIARGLDAISGVLSIYRSTNSLVLAIELVWAKMQDSGRDPEEE
jgi:tyrosine-protein kinase Etk/Wzc